MIVGILSRNGHEEEARDIVNKQALSAKMVELGNKIVDEIVSKGTHHQTLQTVKFVSFNEFKKNYKKGTTILEDWVVDIQKVETIKTDDIEESGLIIYHSDGKMVLPFYKVDKATYQIQGHKKIKRASEDADNGHYRFTVYSGSRMTSAIYERLVMIAYGVYHNRLPMSLRGLECNVIDCTGNPETAKKLGLECNFHPVNLEWVFKQEHDTHYPVCMKVYKITGRPWRVSAFDRYLYELTRNGSYEEVEQYLEWFGLPA